MKKVILIFLTLILLLAVVTPAMASTPNQPHQYCRWIDGRWKCPDGESPWRVKTCKEVKVWGYTIDPVTDEKVLVLGNWDKKLTHLRGKIYIDGKGFLFFKTNNVKKFSTVCEWVTFYPDKWPRWYR